MKFNVIFLQFFSPTIGNQLLCKFYLMSSIYLLISSKMFQVAFLPYFLIKWQAEKFLSLSICPIFLPEIILVPVQLRRNFLSNIRCKFWYNFWCNFRLNFLSNYLCNFRCNFRCNIHWITFIRSLIDLWNWFYEVKKHGN